MLASFVRISNISHSITLDAPPEPPRTLLRLQLPQISPPSLRLRPLALRRLAQARPRPVPQPAHPRVRLLRRDMHKAREAPAIRRRARARRPTHPRRLKRIRITCRRASDRLVHAPPRHRGWHLPVRGGRVRQGAHRRHPWALRLARCVRAVRRTTRKG